MEDGVHNNVETDGRFHTWSRWTPCGISFGGAISSIINYCFTTHSTKHSFKICIIVLNDCFVMKFYNKCKSVVKLCARAQLLGVSRSILEIDEQDQWSVEILAHKANQVF